MKRDKNKRKIGYFEKYKKTIPIADAYNAELFEITLLEKYPECPQKGTFKSNGIYTDITKKLLNKIFQNKIDEGIIFFNREDKIVKRIKEVLIKERDKFLLDHSGNYHVTNILSYHNIIYFDKYIDEYILNNFQSILNSSLLNPMAGMNFDEDTRCILNNCLNNKFYLNIASKEFDRQLSLALHKELNKNLDEDFKETDSIVCITKSGVFYVYIDDEDINNEDIYRGNYVVFIRFGEIKESTVIDSYKKTGLKIKTDDDSEFFIHTENKVLAKSISVFFNVEKYLLKIKGLG